MPKAITPALQALLATRNFYRADCFTFTLANGAVYRWTSFDWDIVSPDARVFSSAGPLFDRTSWKQQVGLAVDQMTVTAFPRSTDELNGLPFLQALRAAVLDGARVQLEIAFGPPVGDVPVGPLAATGLVIVHVGRVAEVRAGRSKAEIQVNSDIEVLSYAWPRNLFSPTCINTLFDVNCGVVQANNAYPYVAAAGSTTTIVRLAAPGAAAGFFNRGQVVFAAGPNGGFARPVGAYDGQNFLLARPLLVAPNAGDAFTAYPGCDRTMGPGGCPKFGGPTTTVARFNAQRNIPQPVMAT